MESPSGKSSAEALPAFVHKMYDVGFSLPRMSQGVGFSSTAVVVDDRGNMYQAGDSRILWTRPQTPELGGECDERAVPAMKHFRRQR